MEGSTALKRLLSSQEIDFQLVPPCLHSRNTAECAIRTFKNHFIVGLCCTWRFGRRPRAVSVAWAHLYALPISGLPLNSSRAARMVLLSWRGDKDVVAAAGMN
jgi:hypothetical protein